MGKDYNVEITEISRRGDGVVRVQGFVVFVREARLGQKVKIKIDHVGPRFAIATTIGHVGEAEKRQGEKEKNRNEVPLT